MTADELDDRFARLEALMRSESAETRRHMDVVAEGLQFQVQVVAEGHDALRADVGELKIGQQRLEAGMARLEVRQEALEYRQERVETRLERVEAGQTELAEEQRALVTEVRLLAARRPA